MKNMFDFSANSNYNVIDKGEKAASNGCFFVREWKDFGYGNTD